jgi:dienelactone hydrolase
VGTVSFHGGLANPTPDNANNIHGKVLAFHGGDDPLVPPQEVEAFKQEMKDAKVNLEFIVYPGAVHAFTNPNAGNDKSKGVAYNKEADESSWKRFKAFLQEVFK